MRSGVSSIGPERPLKKTRKTGGDCQNRGFGANFGSETGPWWGMWAANVAIYPHGGLEGASAIGRWYNRARKAPREDAETGKPGGMGVPKSGFRGHIWGPDGVWAASVAFYPHGGLKGASAVGR